MPLARKRVLVVDDEMLIALETERKLLKAGCTVIGPAARLAPAIAMAREEAPDAAVLDVNLAGSMVWPLAEELSSRGIPFVLVSGYGSALEVPKGLEKVPRLGKPLSEADLIKALASVVMSSQAADANS